MSDFFSARRSQLAAFGLLALWTSVLWWFNATKVQPSRQSHQCQSNLKAIGIAMAQYAKENNETFPPAANWTDALLPYLTSPALLQCPSRPDLEWGYAMNPRLSELSRSCLEETDEIAMVFDSDMGHRNALDWRETVAPLSRHYGGMNIVYTDGHCYGHRRDANFTRYISSPQQSKRK